MAVVHTAVGIEEGTVVVDTEEDRAAVVHTAVDIEVDMTVVDTEENRAAVVHTAVDIEVMFVTDIETEEAMIVRPVVEAVIGIQEDSLADIALEAASIAGLTMNIALEAASIAGLTMNIGVNIQD